MLWQVKEPTQKSRKSGVLCPFFELAKIAASGRLGQAVLIAERLVSGSGWLPVPIRIAEEAAAETTDDETCEETGCANVEAEFSQAAE
ncbi:hypothetical protein [Brucella intermedia]|uniref:hypothetical protein n=1 Tax=Brucella intermedia TaxID=94625 RepID=UPI0012D32356|nr:hypothetical protein [Brucella intermedia]